MATSILNQGKLSQAIDEKIQEIQTAYLESNKPWVIGYSGGKDSTVITQLIWMAVDQLPRPEEFLIPNFKKLKEMKIEEISIISKRLGFILSDTENKKLMIESFQKNTKEMVKSNESTNKFSRTPSSDGDIFKENRNDIYVITTDTLVENPIVSSWVENSLESMKEAASENNLPIKPNLIKPALKDRFWINLIGRGYPSPRRGFRWCTDRLKIKPTNQFIKENVDEHGGVVLVLGVRSAESATRAKSVKKFAEEGGLFSKHQSLDGCMVYSPIADWSNDDVWLYLMKYKNPWNYDNEDLLNLYQGATEDNECPVVVDTSTQSCGSSRFGCWVCTLVTQDKSMNAMIMNDQEKEWMIPLLKFREEIDFHQTDGIEKDRANREFTRMKGQVSYYENKDKEIDTVPGPYKKTKRIDLLEKLLIAETHIESQFKADGTGRAVTLLTIEDLEEIRRIWIEEKNELEDVIPAMYEKIKGKPYHGKAYKHAPILNSSNLRLLESLCSEEKEYELTRNLLVKEMKLKSKGIRRGFINELEKELNKFIYFDKAEALEAGEQRQDIIQMIDINPPDEYEGMKY